MRNGSKQKASATASVIAVAVLLVGCASVAPEARPAGEALPDETYTCWDIPLSGEDLLNPKRTSDLGENGQAALAEATFDDDTPYELPDPDNWIVITETDTQLTLIRPLDEHELPDDEFNGPYGDHEEVTLTTELWPGWHVQSNSYCALTLDLGDLDSTVIGLDPAHPPQSDSSELHLLVLHSACGGDADMPERIEVLWVYEDDSQVNLLIGVEPLGPGGADCGGFPPTPYTIELDSPLGDRAVFDGSRALPRELTLD